jgi:enoyl-CoA hydratase
MKTPGLLTELAGGILRVVIDRPARLNALDDVTCAALTEAFTSVAAETRAIVVTGTGTGASFSAGADVIDLASAAPENDTAAVRAAEHTMRRACALVGSIISCPIPVIAQVNGPAVGIGASIALASDLIYASEDAYFLLAFTKIGLMPDGAASLLIPAAIGRARASAMMLLAQRMTAEEACAVGLINDVLPAAELGPRVDLVARKLIDSPRRALELTKSALTASTLSLLSDTLRRESEGQVELLTSPEFRSRITAFASK